MIEIFFSSVFRPNDRSKKSLLEAGLKAKTAIKNEIEVSLHLKEIIIAIMSS